MGATMGGVDEPTSTCIDRPASTTGCSVALPGQTMQVTVGYDTGIR